MKAYECLVSHYRHGHYSSEGEHWTEIASIEAAPSKDDLIAMYSDDADGEPCDVDLVLEIASVEEGERTIIKTIEVKWSAGQAAQEGCEIVAKHVGEYTTSYVGVNDDGEPVKWTNNGGHNGAHDRMDGSGNWVEHYPSPEVVDHATFLKLAVEYGGEHDRIIEIIRDEIGDEIEATDWDEAHCLDAAENLTTITACEYRFGADACEYRFSAHALMWTDCDGVGVDDVQIVKNVSDNALTDFAEEIASDIGEIVDVAQGGHYTNLGIQIQPTTSDFDRDGYQIVIKKRD